MGECSECGEKSMSFKCHYCGEQFCSKHRLPEKHDCQGLETGKKDEWFDDKFTDKKEKTDETPATTYKPHRRGLTKDIINTLTSSVTLGVIGLTVFSYLLQLGVPAYQDLLILDTQFSELLMRPWSLLTVVLLHGSSLHIFGNMVTFYFFASPVEKLVGGKELLKIYLSSAFFASIAMVLFNNLLIMMHGTGSTPGLVVGASGGVIALVGVISKLFPDADVLLFFIIPMKIKTAVYGVGAFEALNMLLTLLQIEIWIMPIEFLASGGHLAGLLIGLYYGKKLKEKYRPNQNHFNPLGV